MAVFATHEPATRTEGLGWREKLRPRDCEAAPAMRRDFADAKRINRDRRVTRIGWLAQLAREKEIFQNRQRNPMQ
jgi:hypothetical protein